MSMPPWFWPTVRSLAWPGIAIAMFSVAVWRIWPIDWLDSDSFTLLCAMFGAACLIGPDEVVSYWSLRGQGYSSFSAAEARTLEETDFVRVFGLFVLIDAIVGLSASFVGPIFRSWI